MKTEINRMTTLLRETYSGEPWTGYSVNYIISGINAEQAFERKAPGCHTIAELVLHMTAWRVFALKKLQGENSFDIAMNSRNDWPVLKTRNETFWINTLNELELSQYQLIAELELKNDRILEEKVPGKNYTFYTLLHGIIQHDLYHLAQVSLLKKINTYSLSYVDGKTVAVV